MGLKTEKKVIGELEFEVTQLPAMRAFNLFAKLAKTIGPAMGALSTFSPDTELTLAGPALAVAFSKLDAEEASALVPKILETTRVYMDGKYIELNRRENLDTVFNGRLGVMFQALGFAIQVQFGDFFEGSEKIAP